MFVKSQINEMNKFYINIDSYHKYYILSVRIYYTFIQNKNKIS